MNIHREADEIFADGVKVAYIHNDGTLRMTRGNSDKRQAVEEWMSQPEDESEESSVVLGDDATEDAPMPEVPPVLVAAPNTPEPPKGCPTMGDKDPKVIAWYYKNKPEEAAKRYAGRKGTNLQPYK